MRYLLWSTVHKPSFTMSRVVSSDKPHTAVKRHGSSVAAEMQPSVLLSGGEPSPRVHPPTHSWALDNSKVFMFSEQNVPKGGDFATVACFYVAGAPKKNVFFVLRVFLCINSYSSSFTWTLVASLFQCLSIASPIGHRMSLVKPR